MAQERQQPLGLAGTRAEMNVGNEDRAYAERLLRNAPGVNGGKQAGANPQQRGLDGIAGTSEIVGFQLRPFAVIACMGPSLAKDYYRKMMGQERQNLTTKTQRHQGKQTN